MKRFPSGISVRDARSAISGVRIVCATGRADGAPHPDLAGVYEVTNLTSDALIVAPVVNRAMGYEAPRFEPRLDKRRSVLIEAGVSRHTYPHDVVIFMHPDQLARLHALLGFDGSRAWRRPVQVTS